jgi:hypothetical protein
MVHKINKAEMYHVADALKTLGILVEGLKPKGKLPEYIPTVSAKSRPEYIYLWDNLKSAKMFAEVVASEYNMRTWVLKVDARNKKLEPDFDMEVKGSWKTKDSIPKGKIKMHTMVDYIKRTGKVKFTPAEKTPAGKLIKV